MGMPFSEDFVQYMEELPAHNGIPLDRKTGGGMPKHARPTICEGA